MIDIGYTTTLFEDTITETVNTMAEANEAIFALRDALSDRGDIYQLFMQQLMPDEDGELVKQQFVWLNPSE